METVTIREDIITYLDDLVDSLFARNYFHTEQAAQAYVSSIYDFIEFQLTSFPLKNTPPEIKQLGLYYVVFRKSQRTSWYIFFEKKDNRYLVTFITNNHMEIAAYL